MDDLIFAAVEGYISFGEKGALVSEFAITNSKVIDITIELLQWAGASDENWKECQRRLPMPIGD